MNRGSFELSVSIPRDGRATPLREFGHNGFTYVESREGQKFSLKFKNNTAHRVLAVASIDGLSVLEGTKATPQSRGYIIPPYAMVEIKGWRTSLSDINNFVFETKSGGKTYSEGAGEGTGNCGVVAVKVFAEKEKPKPITQIIREEHHHHHDHYPPYVPPYRPPWKPWPEYWCSTTGGYSGNASLAGGITRSVDPSTRGRQGPTGPQGDPGVMGDPGEPLMCFMNSVAEPEFTSDQTLGTSEKYEGQVKKGLMNAPAFNMGTGFGQHEIDRVTEEVFERGSELATLEIYYTDAAALKEIGIDVEKKVAVNVMPQAFQPGFCKAPVAK
jgi:hypothetical protein